MTAPVELKLSKLHNCLWKSSCQNYTTEMHIHKLSKQTNLTETNRRKHRGLWTALCLTASKKGVKGLRFNACFSCWGSHNLQHMSDMPKRNKIKSLLVCLSKPLHFADFVLQQKLAKNSVFKGIYCYYDFNMVASIPHLSVFSHWNRIGGSRIKIQIRYTVTCQMMWY